MSTGLKCCAVKNPLKGVLNLAYNTNLGTCR